MKKITITKDELLQMANDNFSVGDISKKLEITYMQARYLLKRHDVKTKGNNCKYDWSKDNILKGIKNSECKSDIMRNMGIPIFAGNFRTLERLCKSFSIDLSFLNEMTARVNCRGNKFKKTPSSEVFIENSAFAASSSLRERVIKEGILENKCYKCGNGDSWLGEKLSLELDHINGNNTDHRVENLRIACPNCHSQTANYRGRNKKKIKKEKVSKKREIKYKFNIDKEELQKLVWEKPIIEIAKMFNVSDTSILKRCKKMSIEKPKRGHWVKKNE